MNGLPHRCGALALTVLALAVVPAAASGALAPVNTSSPSLEGQPVVGDQVSCQTGTWSGTTPITFRFQWLRDAVAIAGAESQTYVIEEADAGHQLACTVTARNSAGAASRTTSGVTIAAADVTEPRLTHVSLRPTRFNPARGGAIVRYSVNEACTLLARLDRYVTRTHRYVRMHGSFKVESAAGRHSFRFSGRVGGRALRSGRYRLSLAARDLAQNTAAAVRVPFTIIR